MSRNIILCVLFNLIQDTDTIVRIKQSIQMEFYIKKPGLQIKLQTSGSNMTLNQCLPSLSCYVTHILLGIKNINFLSQEAYSVARQFNLIPPIAEQPEYHLFQREKVELQMPELYHKIGKSRMPLLFVSFQQ